MNSTTPALESSSTDPSAKQLVVLSGKGGTGKTSVVAALATIAANKVLADCDVDAADLHLVLRPETERTKPFVAGKEASILAEQCTACGECFSRCRFDAISPATTPGGKAIFAVDPLACEGCGLCARVCSYGAVKLTAAERGEWYVSTTPEGPLVHARLNAGGENSGKLVTLVREESMDLARKSGARLVLVDGPPGIGCPVIASTTGADLVLAVTEPTVSGAHDLERLADLVKGFGIPMTVCINKADLNPRMAAQIRDACAERGLTMVGELSYDQRVIEAQVRGQSIVEYGGTPVAEQITEMWKNLQTILAEAEDS
jgi:MinD superfamily P-loop ATPase